MKKSPLGFFLMDGAELPAIPIVPESCEYPISFAEPLLHRWHSGTYLEQRYIHTHFGFCLLTFSIEKRAMLQVVALDNFSTIQFTLKGDSTCFLSGHGLISLIEKTYTPLYIPKGVNYVWFEKGVYTFLYIILGELPLRDMATEHPELGALLQQQTATSSKGMMTERIPIDHYILRTIKKLEKTTKTGVELNLFLQRKILLFLLHYNKQKRELRSGEALPTRKDYAARIKLFITDNINDPSLLQMEHLEKVFYASRRTLERYFFDSFQQSLKSFITALRLQRAFYLLQLPDASVETIAEELGYTETKNFIQSFSRYYGFSPKDARKYF